MHVCSPNLVAKYKKCSPSVNTGIVCIIKKCISTVNRINLEPEISKKENHIFKDVFPWKNDKELAHHIVSNCLLYNNDEGLVAINKPYGLALQPLPIKSRSISNVQTLNTSLCSTYNGSLSRVLPLIASQLELETLNVVKAPERYNSGVTLLATTKSLEGKIKKNYLRVFSSKLLCEQYLAVTIGFPTSEHFSGILGLVLQENENNKNKQAIIVPTISMRERKKGSSKLVSVEHQVLSTNSDIGASLVRVSPSTRTWHFLRVYLASVLSPVLGDNVHGSRVTFRVGPEGKAINPMSHLAQLPQTLPFPLLQALELSKKQESIIPVHVHLSQLTIPKFLDNDEDLVINAPVPPTFRWTCEQLGLQLPT